MYEASANALRKRRAALASMAASAALTLLKLGAGLLTGSLALTSEGAHNAVDIAVSASTYFAVREADKPADEDHPFGHAKIEAVAALAQTGLLFALALGVVSQAVWRLADPGPRVDANVFAFGAIVVSLGVDLVRWRTLSRLARETGSDALAADALHYSSDLVSSALVLAGLALSRWGFARADAFAAIGVSLFIAFAGYELGRRTIDSLLDAAPRGLAARVRLFTESEPGVDSVEYVRLRRSGPHVVGDLGVFVSRTLPFEQVASIKLALSGRLGDRWPNMALTIIASPRALDDETILERVLVIAARRRLFVHHVAVRRLQGRPSVTLDLEVDGRLSLVEAHAVATRLEDGVRAELGEPIEVETHIEPLEMRELPGQDAEAEAVTRLAQTIRRIAAKDGALIDIHDVRLRSAEGALYAIFHCRAPREMTVQEAHEAVDALERAVRRETPELTRIIGHVEPLQAGD